MAARGIDVSTKDFWGRIAAVIPLAVLFMLLAVLCGCTSVFYQPDHLMHAPPELNGVAYENLYFKSDAQTYLHAWYIPATTKKTKGLLIQFHGNSQNISSNYLSLAWLAEKGYGIFTFDYRGYGESTGSPTPEGIYEDGLAALNQAWKLREKIHAQRFIVYGQSLGGAIAMRCFADFPHRNETSLVVLDSTFMSYKDVARQTLAKFWLTWPFSPLGNVLVSDAYSSANEVKSLKTRLLVIHDRRDPVVKFQNGQEIYDAATAPKDFWVTDSGTHVGIFYIDGMKYRQAFVKFADSL